MNELRTISYYIFPNVFLLLDTSLRITSLPFSSLSGCCSYLISKAAHLQKPGQRLLK